MIPVRKQVRAQFLPEDLQPGRFLDGNREGARSPGSTGENGPNVLTSATNVPGQGRDGIDARREVHDSMVRKCLTKSRNNSLSLRKEKSDNQRMGRTKKVWIKRSSFRVLVDLWLDAHPGSTKTTLAQLIGLKDGNSFKQYYSGKECPSPDLTKKMAEVLGCTEEELTDDPNQPPPSPELEEVWKSSDIRLRALSLTMMRVAQSIPPDKMDDFIAMLEKGQEMARLLAKGKPLSK